MAELLLLVGVLVMWRWLGGPGERIVLVALAAIAMGIQSAVVLRFHTGPTTTYVTGTLTTFTMRMIRRLRRGGPESSPVARQASAPEERPWIYGVTWSVYLVGAVVTALLYLWSHVAALLLPIAALAVVTLAAHAADLRGLGVARPQ